MWLPRHRTSENPFRARIAHTSRPDKTRSLPNLDLDLSYKKLCAASACHLAWVGRFEKQGNSFVQIADGFFDGST
jgi:hypothetical protein